jgi:hypothetical protein
MTGHYTFHLSDAEVAALKEYLDRGGVLVAEECCGRAAFDKALRGLVAQMSPDGQLKELPADHQIYRNPTAGSIEAVTYSPAVQAESPELKRPVLLGLVREGHLVFVYSPYGLAPGLDGIKTYGARCLAPDDARHLAVSIFLNIMVK